MMRTTECSAGAAIRPAVALPATAFAGKRNVQNPMHQTRRRVITSVATPVRVGEWKDSLLYGESSPQILT